MTSTKKKKKKIRAPKNSPIPGVAGMWVSRVSFKGHKSFGCFVCTSCNNRWLSAHAFPQHTQGCKKCDQHTLPMFMWVNQHSSSDSDKHRKNTGKPHDMERCSACAAGICIGISRSKYVPINTCVES